MCMCIPNTQNVLNFQDFTVGMLKYLRGRYYIMNATLPVTNTVLLHKLMES